MKCFGKCSFRLRAISLRGTHLALYAFTPLSLEDNQFGFAITSYVPHGMVSDERKLLYALMSRLATKYVIIHDYNGKRGLLTSFIEWMEGGDYFSFIKHPKCEMENCVTEMRACFKKVEVL